MQQDGAPIAPTKPFSRWLPASAVASAIATRWRAPGAVAAVLLAATVVLAACRSSSSRAEVKQTCQQVEAVLSDGPEPQADPVGYAQAQILPLHQIHTSDGKLRQAIDKLASAYEAFSSSDGARQIEHTVTSASKAIDVICPGATS
jgi:hypothetical protein